PDSDGHAIANSRHTRPLGYILECAVFPLMEKPVPIFWVILHRHCSFGHGIGDMSSIHDEDVQTTVIVVIEQGDTRTHSFWKIFLRGGRSLVFEVKIDSVSDVLKANGRG